MNLPSRAMLETLRPKLAAAIDFLRQLFDMEFRRLLTPRMLPTIYLLAMLASAYGVVAYAIQGFAQSTTLGLVRLLLIGPVAFFVLVTLSRIALELCLVAFRIAVHVNEMAGHTEDLAGSMPRIQFWKTPRKRSDDGR